METSHYTEFLEASTIYLDLVAQVEKLLSKMTDARRDTVRTAITVVDVQTSIPTDRVDIYIITQPVTRLQPLVTAVQWDGRIAVKNT